jgi:hypothetical protein
MPKASFPCVELPFIHMCGTHQHIPLVPLSHKLLTHIVHGIGKNHEPREGNRLILAITASLFMLIHRAHRTSINDYFPSTNPFPQDSR